MSSTKDFALNTQTYLYFITNISKNSTSPTKSPPPKQRKDELLKTGRMNQILKQTMMAMAGPIPPPEPPPSSEPPPSKPPPDHRPAAEMAYYLSHLYQRPITLRLKSDVTVRCPFCLKSHDHGSNIVGYTKPPEECTSSSPGLVINDRVFNPSYGYTVMEYDCIEGVYMLSQPPNLPRVDLNLIPQIKSG